MNATQKTTRNRRKNADILKISLENPRLLFVDKTNSFS